MSQQQTNQELKQNVSESLPPPPLPTPPNDLFQAWRGIAAFGFPAREKKIPTAVVDPH